MALSVAGMIQALLGVNTYQVTDRETATVGLTAVRVARGNPQRAFLLIVNLSANTIYVSPDNRPSAAHGIILTPNGGSVSVIWDRDLELTTAEWFAIAGGAASAIMVLESIIG